MVNAQRDHRLVLSRRSVHRDNSRVQFLISLAAGGIGLNVFAYSYTFLHPPTKQLLGDRPASSQLEPPQRQLKASDVLTEAQLWDLFKGGSDSLIARSIGVAEGTRNPNGTRTSNWYGHEDPGDRRWNLGTFSYNPTRDGTTISDPEVADRYYLEILRKQTQSLAAQAKQLGLSLTLEEWVNAIDLANQSPQASLGWKDRLNPGFMVNLVHLKKKGLSGQAAILEARLEGFRNTQTGKYEAWTGLAGLKQDQERRMLAVRESSTFKQQQSKQTVSFTSAFASFATLEPQNPYGTRRWESVGQQAQSFYWQMGIWDGLNHVPPTNSDQSYRLGYQIGFNQLSRGFHE
jgi:hypothetical protein